MTKLMQLASMAALLAAAPSSAAVVFSTSHNGAGGNCIFNTTCAQAFSVSGVLAGQKFTLGQNTSLTSASFTAIDLSGIPTAVTSVNWQFLFVDTNTGLPGALISSGSSAISLRALNANQFGDFVGNVFDFHYSLPSVALAAGDYYLGFEAVSSDFNVYLSNASPAPGAATFNESGNPVWVANYRGYTGVAISLSDGGSGVVPEPASWAMLIAGFGLVGGAMRRRTLAPA